MDVLTVQTSNLNLWLQAEESLKTTASSIMLFKSLNGIHASLQQKSVFGLHNWFVEHCEKQACSNNCNLKVDVLNKQ
jgi:hypothetical protein